MIIMIFLLSSIIIGLVLGKIYRKPKFLHVFTMKYGDVLKFSHQSIDTVDGPAKSCTTNFGSLKPKQIHGMFTPVFNSSRISSLATIEFGKTQKIHLFIKMFSLELTKFLGDGESHVQIMSYHVISCQIKLYLFLIALCLVIHDTMYINTIFHISGSSKYGPSIDICGFPFLHYRLVN